MVLGVKLTRVAPLLLAATGFGLCWSGLGAAQGEAGRPLGEPSATAPAASVCASRLQCERLLAQAAKDGPTYATAQAWMDLARLEAEGGQPNTRHVLKAFETLKVVLAQDRGTRPADPAGRDSDLFRVRLLPIFQAAADALAYDRVADGSTPADPALIASLLDLGETARRAQIELVLADSCEPLQVSLAPDHLLPGETIVYPIVGTRRTYLLVGRKPNRAGRAAAGDGWTLLGGGRDSGAKTISKIADALIERLPKSALDYANAPLRGSPSDWDEDKARSLYEMLIHPLAGRFLPADAPGEGEPAETLIFLPDPVLRNVPWALLHGGMRPGRAGPDYLVRRVAIAVGPALAYVSPSTRTGYRGPLMVGGLGDALLADFVPQVAREDDIAPWIVAALSGPSASGATISGSAKGPAASARRGPFTRGRLERELERGDFSTLLLATHARYLRGASYFQIHDEVGPGAIGVPVDDIETRLRQGRRRGRALDLLVFLACEGAAGGAGDLGLAGAALRGGAKSTVGSLTLVEADSAKAYFSRAGSGGRDKQDFLSLYYDSKTPQSPAQALRRVQMSYMGNGESPPPRHLPAFPANWGVLVVIGNWR